AQPGYADARSQLTWVLADLRPSLEPGVLGSIDSDRNRTTLWSLTGTAPAPWRGRLAAVASHRLASFAGLEGTASALRGSATWGDRAGLLSARGELGAARLRAERPGAPLVSRSVTSAMVRGAVRPSARLAVGATLSRVPFDETATLIERGIVTSTAGVEAEWTLPARLALSVAAEAARLTGGATTNRRRAASAALRWNQSRRWSYALSARGFGYDSTTREGYFAPERYTLVEGSARLQLGRELGWSGGAEGGVGAQTIRLTAADPTSRAAQRARGWVTWRPVPGYEVLGAIGWANVASPGQVQGGDYSATTFSVGGRIRL
ncbi:MAG TPA: hypothetical protein VEA99_05910, partial [Gemmatimonadaceae bacterium]|nr:hypothetical protein [Gemmatimonadaceae bacterium]